MSTTQTLQKATTKGSELNGDSRGLLQRKCNSCGHHTIAGGSCSRCETEKGVLQKKLIVGAPDDPLEREADRVADQVMAEQVNSGISWSPPTIQRYSGQASKSSNTAPGKVERALASSGRPLEPSIRQGMEQRFRHDFSHVRIHTGADAERSAQELSANAYTIKNDIVFGMGKYEPTSQEGRRLIAHELTHVVQQNQSQSVLVQRDISQVGMQYQDAPTGSILEQAFETADSRRWEVAARLANGLNNYEMKYFLGQYEPKWIYQLHLGALKAEGVGSKSAIALATEKTYDEIKQQEDLRYQQYLAEQNGATASNTKNSGARARPSVTASNDDVKPASVLKVGNTVIDNASLTPVAGVLIGGTQVARGVLTVNSATLGGGAEAIVLAGGELTETAAAVEAATEVSGLSAAALRQTLAIRAALAAESAAAAATATEASSLIVAATSAAGLGAIGVGFSIGIGVGIVIIPFAISYAAQVLARLGPFGGTLPPGGLTQPPMQDPGDAGVAYAPASDAAAPAYAPSTSNGGPAFAPGSQGRTVLTPGKSSESAQLSDPRKGPYKPLSVRPPKDVTTPSGKVIQDPGLEGRRSDDPWIGIQRNRIFEANDNNLSEMLNGRPPLGKDGMKINLHHRGKQPNGPLDELTQTEHQQQSRLLHDDEYSRVDRPEFDEQRARYWVSRARSILRIE